ncbi:hypothetical protein F0225_19050 [Vibrio pectenicida]|uniref:Uncharacterized protein n=1 Tax=Vibrio pectenicida TaxID=62763 RepID=A0A7Y4A2A8_9VIBR|nr:hypothetical protein [Vibrio pectenicida]
MTILALVSCLACADIIEPDDTNNWTIEGLSHYIRSKENSYISANLTSNGKTPSVVALVDSDRFCPRNPQSKKIKVAYQWVNYVTYCSSGVLVWIPRSKQGKEFVKQRFSGNSEVNIIYNNETFTFSTKKFTSVRQSWERSLKTLGTAL